VAHNETGRVRVSEQSPPTRQGIGLLLVRLSPLQRGAPLMSSPRSKKQQRNAAPFARRADVHA